MAVAAPAAGADAAPPTVSVVLAVLNERRSLPELFERLRAVGLPPWEAIVVDDGSSDGSREYVAELARRDRRVRLLLHEGRQTTLTAQCMAIETARGRYVAVMDADLQHPPELLPALVGELERGAAVALASRYAPGGSPGARPPLRAVLSRGAEAIARMLLPATRGVGDPVSGYFALRRDVFVAPVKGTRGYKLLLFVLVMARGRRVREVPFRFEARSSGTSKVTSGVGFVRLFLTELLLARRFARQLARAPGPQLPGG